MELLLLMKQNLSSFSPHLHYFHTSPNLLWWVGGADLEVQEHVREGEEGKEVLLSEQLSCSGNYYPLYMQQEVAIGLGCGMWE